MNKIEVTQEQLAQMVKKAVMAEIGSQSVKKLRKDQPSIDISTKEKLIAAFEAVGVQNTVDFIAEYKPAAIGEKGKYEGKPTGGYSFATTTEKPAFGKQAKLWVKTGTLMGLASLDQVEKNVKTLDSEIASLKEAIEVATYLRDGFKGIYGQMVENEPKD